MKRFLKFFAAAVMASAALFACKKDEVQPETLEVTPSEDLHFLAKDNEDVILTVNASASSYEVDAEDWVVTAKDGNRLTVNVRDNTSGERSCEMTITAGAAQPVVINIIQDGVSEPVVATFKDKSGSDEVTLTYSASGISATVVFELASALESGSAGATVVTDESYLGTYNSANSTSYSLFPTANVTIPDEGRISISGASTSGSLDLTLNPAELDPGTYLLPLKVTDITGNISVSENKDRVNYIVTVPTPAAPKNKKNLLIMECNDANPLNVLELKYTDGTLFFQSLVLFSSNIIFDPNTMEVRFSYNNNVEALLNEKETYIKPLQDAGVKVYLSLLPHHTEAWLSNMKPATQKALAAEVAEVVRMHNLDGVFLDDEYREGTPENYPDVFYSASSMTYYAEFAYELKQALKQACEWETDVILYQLNGNEIFSAINGVPANEFIDYAMGDYGYSTYGAESMGLSDEQCFANGHSLTSYSSQFKWPPTKSSATKWAESPYEWFAIYNYDMDPSSDTFRWKNHMPAFLQGYANMVCGCDILAPKAYYKKLGEGAYDPTRYEYDFDFTEDWNSAW